MIKTIDSCIAQKVKTLWEERNMISFCNACNTTEKQAKLIQDIISQIQYVIYDIDSQFEENMNNDTSELAVICRQGKVAIAHILDLYTYKMDDSLIQPLLDFQQMEIDMRAYAHNPSLKSPLDYPIVDFYLLKSCDIYLNRKIITSISGKDELYTALVQKFDQLGEILDDMIDVEEDRDAINSNRFLISLVERGAEKTLQEYRDFINQSLPVLIENEGELNSLGLDVRGLQQQLFDYLGRDWSCVKESKTNKMLFGEKK